MRFLRTSALLWASVEALAWSCFILMNSSSDIPRKGFSMFCPYAVHPESNFSVVAFDVNWFLELFLYWTGYRWFFYLGIILSAKVLENYR